MGMSTIFSQDTDDYMIYDENGEEYQLQPDSYNEDGNAEFLYNGNVYLSSEIHYYPKGRIVYYGHSEYGICDVPLLIPGTALLPRGFLAVCYGLGLIYLFLGI